MKFKKLKGIIGMAMVATMLFSNNVVFAATAQENKDFTWDNASVYFTLTDRFNNGDTSNDHAYGRSVGEVDANSYQTRLGTFHGGDLKGLQDKVDEGYFDDLGINAIWITAPYEQIHGALCGQGFKHYAYHGYYTLDYTNVDGNMGTAQDLENFIDAAHSHGIRVIFDVVMNHAGYADPVTANEYGFGKLDSNWKDIYYNTNESDYKWYNDYSGEAASYGAKGMMDPNGDWSTNWWGPDWIRAVSQRFNGYEGSESGDDKTLCTSGLPDFKTESTKELDVPGLLKTKWQKEGRYDQEMNKLNTYFNQTGKPRTVNNYLVKWLSDWVREYGVDGFRCDTAKHVDISCWKSLKDECKDALQEWRANNPDKPGAEWNDDFWMTGESWGHGVGKDNYYTSGAFDSMINFAYQGSAFASTDQIEGIYSDYASRINSDPTFNALSYISSHDKGLARGDMIKAGTNLLLLPGGIQIFYGDETGRVGGSSEQSWRSEMNWDSMDTKELAHWQKVGKFRSNHPAVGAGQHAKLAASPYTFSRTYKLGTADEDKVVVSMPGKSGSVNVSVGNVFNDGDGVKDAYTGKEYTVSGGSVNVTAGENGLVLLESNGKVSPAVGISVKGKEYWKDTLQVTLNAANVVNAQYKINDGEYQNYENGQVVTIGEGAVEGDVTTITVIGTDANGNTVGPKSETYTKVATPDGYKIHVKNSSWTSAPNAYVYIEDGSTVEKLTGAWPGKQMVADEENPGWYTIEIEDENALDVNAKVIFNGSWGQYPGQNQPGIEVVNGEVWVSDNVVVDPPVVKKGSVNVKYVDADTLETIAPSQTLTGNVGDAYTTAQKTIEGYTFSSVEGNVSGQYAEGTSTVIYKYTKDVPPVEKLTLTGLTADLQSPQNAGTKVTIKANANKTQGVSYKYWAYTPDEQWVLLSDYSYNSTVEWTPDKEGNYIIWAYAKDEDGNTSYAAMNYTATEKASLIDENNASIAYTGNWITENDSRFNGGTSKSTDTDGSSLELSFTGTGIKILGTSAQNKGVAKVTLDGKVYSADMYSDTTKFKDTVFEQRGLSSDIHKLILEYSGLQSYGSTGTTVGVDGFEIFGGNIL